MTVVVLAYAEVTYEGDALLGVYADEKQAIEKCAADCQRWLADPLDYGCDHYRIEHWTVGGERIGNPLRLQANYPSLASKVKMNNKIGVKK